MAMGSGSILFSCFFLGYVFVFSLLGIWANGTIQDITKDVEESNDIGQRPVNHDDYWTLFQNDDFFLPMEDTITHHSATDSPNDEEWMAIISALSEDSHPDYLKKHGYVVHQVQTGSYNYSYGNEGTYKSKFYGKIHRHGNHGHSAGMYFQMAEGTTGKVHYMSGFALFRNINFSMERASAHWHGGERALYFNKNPDGSYTVFGFSSANTEGKVVPKSRKVLEITTKTLSVLNTTQFVAKSISNSDFQCNFEGGDNDLTGTIEMITKEENGHQVPQNINGFAMNATLKLQGVFPKYGKGDFHTSFDGIIQGSVVNSTLVGTTKGHTWVGWDALGTMNMKDIFDSNFWINVL